MTIFNKPAKTIMAVILSSLLAACAPVTHQPQDMASPTTTGHSTSSKSSSPARPLETSGIIGTSSAPSISTSSTLTASSTPSAPSAPSTGETIVLPPTRLVPTQIRICGDERYTLQTAFSKADVLARVKVGNWLGEDLNTRKSYYESTCLQCFKGNLPDTFTLLQDGCSIETLPNYPLFTYGNELLVFLKKGSSANDSSEFWIMGSYRTFFDVSYDRSGHRYYADRYGYLGETAETTRNYARKQEIFSEVYSYLAENDPIAPEMPYTYPCIFLESDFFNLLEIPLETP